jgi:hypothetical protein
MPCGLITRPQRRFFSYIENQGELTDLKGNIFCHLQLTMPSRTFPCTKTTNSGLNLHATMLVGISTPVFKKCLPSKVMALKILRIPVEG